MKMPKFDINVSWKDIDYPSHPVEYLTILYFVLSVILLTATLTTAVLR